MINVQNSSLGRNNTSNKYTFEADNNSIELKKTTKENDLGTVIDSQLDFGENIIQTVGKANRHLGLITRCFSIRDRQSLLLLYKSKVRPILEYGSVVWSPCKKKYQHDRANTA